MELNEAYKQIKDEVLNNTSLKKDANSSLLALYESTTKIWEAVENNQKEKIELRVASALISVFYVMKELGIKNPEECLNKKLAELKLN
ncbi:MAG: hypothetical protein WC025_01250 [Candidatus Magasanikbacteria bacterium]